MINLCGFWKNISADDVHTHQLRLGTFHQKRRLQSHIVGIVAHVFFLFKMKATKENVVVADQPPRRAVGPMMRVISLFPASMNDSTRTKESISIPSDDVRAQKLLHPC